MPRVPSNIPFPAIFFLALLLWGGEYIRRDLWEPDEARYALVSREMREGHWLVPYRQGEFYSHKPPLMFWLTNGFSLATGGTIGSLAPRLPSFFGAIMALWVAVQLATRWFSSRAGWMTLILLPSSFLFWNKGGFGQIDMLLCGLEMMALYGLFTAKGSARLAMAYALMGLGILAKGPVGFLVPLGVFITATWAAGDAWPKPRSHWVWGPLITLAFPAAWLLAAWLQGAPEGFFAELLFKQNVGRATGEFGGHQKPFYYFLTYFPVDFLPWSLLLPLSYVALKRNPTMDPGRRRLLGWIVFVVIFFSLSASKRNLYILLAYPAAAMLVAAGAENWHRVSWPWLRNSFGLIWSLFLVLGCTMMVGVFIKALPINTLTLLPGGMTLLAGCWWALESWRSQPHSPNWLAAMSMVMLLNFAGVGALVFPEFDAMKSPDELVDLAHHQLDPTDRIVMYKQHGEIHSLYTQRKGIMIDEPEDLREFLATAPQPHHLIIALERHAADLAALIEAPSETLTFRMGSKELVAISLGKPIPQGVE